MALSPSNSAVEDAHILEQSEEWAWLDARLPQVTTEAISGAMAGFDLDPEHGRGPEWLAMAARRVLGLTIPDPEDDPATMPSNSQIRDSLRTLANQTRDLWLALSTTSPAVEDAILDLLFDQKGASDLATMMEQYTSKRDGLMTLFSVLSAAANAAASGPGKQSARWRQAARRHLRIERAQFLVPIFEMTFGTPATGNDYPSGKATAPTNFMDFYQRVASVAFGEKATPDLAAIVKEALKRHKVSPLRLAPRIVPGFSNLME